MIDIEIRQFRDDLLNMINSTQLPIEIKRLVIAEISTVVSQASDNFINEQTQSVIAQLNDENNKHESPIEKEENDV